MNRLIVIFAAALALGACSSYSKLLKGTDHQAQYEAAKSYIESGKYERARMLLEKVRMPYVATPQADSIMFFEGLVQYREKQWDVSGEVFDRFRVQYQRSPLLEQAEYMYAEGLYNSSPEAVRDQSATVQAIDAIDTYTSRYPGSEHREQMLAQRAEMVGKLHDKSFLNARTYYKIGEFKSAITALRNAQKEYPESKHREDILNLIVLSSYEYAANSIPAMRRERYLDMMERYLNYIAEYPEGQYAEHLKRLNDRAQKYVDEGEPVETDGKKAKKDGAEKTE